MEPGKQARFSARIRNEMGEFVALNERLDAFIAENALPENLAFPLRLTVEEVLTNQIKYAYPDGGEHFLELKLELDGEAVLAVFSDDGAEFNPLLAAPPDLTLPLENRPIGGLGLHLVRAVSSAASYRREGGKNILELTIKGDL